MCLDFVMKVYTTLLSKVGSFCWMRFWVKGLNPRNISILRHWARIARGKQFPLPSVISSSFSGSWSLLTTFMISMAILCSSWLAILPYNETISLMYLKAAILSFTRRKVKKIKSFWEYSVEGFSEVLNVHHPYSTFLLIDQFYLVNYSWPKLINEQRLVKFSFVLFYKIADFKYYASWWCMCVGGSY